MKNELDGKSASYEKNDHIESSSSAEISVAIVQRFGILILILIERCQLSIRNNFSSVGELWNCVDNFHDGSSS